VSETKTPKPAYMVFFIDIPENQHLASELLTNPLTVQKLDEIRKMEVNLVLGLAPVDKEPNDWFYNVWMHRKLDALDWVTPFEAIKHGAGDLVIHYLTPKVNRLK